MSIKIMSYVWEHGPDVQSERFVLLALADYANDDGYCWPAISGLMRKTCLSERGVQSVLRRLRDSGWVDIEVGGGRKNCNLYRIKTPQQMHPAADAPPQMKAETPQMDALNPAPAAPEPSRTIIEPSKREDAIASLSDRADHDASVAVRLYNEAAASAGWPSVQKLTQTRSRSLKARVAEAGGMDGWRIALEKAAASDFICGRTAKPWTGFGFDWLVKSANFTKLMEGNYDNRTNQSPSNRTGSAGSPRRGGDSFYDDLAAVLGVDAAQGRDRF